MKMRYPILISGGLCCSVWGFIYRPFPMPGDDPALDLVLYHTPNFYGWIVRWYYGRPRRRPHCRRACSYLGLAGLV